MHHDLSLISTLAAGFALALVFGFVASRLRMPPLVGYLLAGVAIGPATPGFVGDLHLAGQLSEIGVMLLMFGVGLHFSLGDLKAVRRVAVPGAIVQIAVAVAMGAGLAHWWGWSLGAALVFGLSLSVASTVVLLKALEARNWLETPNGRIAVGWLVVEDLVMVLVLVLLPVLPQLLDPAAHAAQVAAGQAASGGLWATLLLTLAKVGGFMVVMLWGGRRLLPKLLTWVAATGSRELFTLSVLTLSLGLAYGAALLFGVSFALGAFFAGMVMQESEFSHRAADESLPLRDAFAVLFFVSVGMLVDPAVIWQQPLQLLATVGVIVVGKTIAAVALVLLLRYPLNTALTVGAGLAQIGEFSFILAGLGVSLGLMPAAGQSLILAAALVSIAVNAALFGLLSPVLNWAREHSAWARQLEARDDPLAQLPDSVPASALSDQVVLVGHDELGRALGSALRQAKMNVVVADANREEVERLREQGVHAVAGDLLDPATLIQAHVARARWVIVTLADPLVVQHVVSVVRELQAPAHIVACAPSQEEAQAWRRDWQIDTWSAQEALVQGLVGRLAATAAAGPSGAHGAPAPH
ncbi:MAG: hypothetical protein RI907_271 [Pseudomonadota bacterium]|jgi:CPA2 family monovalent cation:H+ antiporter-2